MNIYRDYKSLKDSKGIKQGDIIYFGEIEYIVYTQSLSAYCGDNNLIFSKLDIKYKYNFCSNAYEYISGSGTFPECHMNDYQALMRVARVLMGLYEKKFVKKNNISESLFKVGDKVTILSEYLPGTIDYSYQRIFVENMLRSYAGKVYTIETVTKTTRVPQRNLSNDLYEYQLKGIGYIWSAEMFEETYKKSPYSAAKREELIRVNSKNGENKIINLYNEIQIIISLKESSNKNYSISLEPEIEIQINKKHYTI